MLVYTVACELGATEANKQVVLGHGANWIKTQAQKHFPAAVRVLEWLNGYRKFCNLLDILIHFMVYSLHLNSLIFHFWHRFRL